MKKLLFILTALFTMQIVNAQYTKTVRNYHSNEMLSSIGEVIINEIAVSLDIRNPDLKTGQWEYYYDNGQLEKSGEYYNGVKTGQWKYYYFNGQLEKSGEWDIGVKTGEWEYYHSDGIRNYFYDDEDLERGMKYYNNRDYQTALLNFEKCGEKGSRDCSSMLYQLYLFGYVEFNEEKALYWIKKSKTKLTVEIYSRLGYGLFLKTNEMTDVINNTKDVNVREELLIKQKKNYIKAITYFKKASNIEPNNPGIYYSLGVVSTQSGEIDSARKYYDKALVLNPKYYSALINIASLVLTKDGTIINEMNSLGNSDADHDRYDQLIKIRKKLHLEVISYYRRAFELDKNNIEVIRSLRILYSETGMEEEAKQMKIRLDKLENK